MYSIFDSVEKLFNSDLWDDFFDWKKVDKVFKTSCGSFPPTDIIINKETKDLTYKFALAGYKLEDFDLSFENNKMILEVNSENKSEDKTEQYLVNGIKKSKQKISYIVPKSKYNTEDVKAIFTDGILEVTIPARENVIEDKVKIQISSETS